MQHYIKEDLCGIYLIRIVFRKIGVCSEFLVMPLVRNILTKKFSWKDDRLSNACITFNDISHLTSRHTNFSYEYRISELLCTQCMGNTEVHGVSQRHKFTNRLEDRYNMRFFHMKVYERPSLRKLAYFYRTQYHLYGTSGFSTTKAVKQGNY